MVKKFNYVMSERMDEGDDYFRLFSNVVNVLETARTKLARQFSATVASSYWEIGKLLAELKLEGRHGDGVVKRLSSDLKHLYPDMGFSPRNLWNMKKFYHRYESSDLKLQQAVAVLPWSHNLLLLSKGVNDEAVMFYSHEVVSKGWSRDMLNHALKSGWHLSAMLSESFNNFAAVLPDKQAEYANEVFRSRYNLGFVAVETPLKELELERKLVEKVTSFILELGRGFAFIGNQHVLCFNNKEYKVDMLFYHRNLRALVAVDLKIGEFRPEYVGKMNYYLSLLNKLEKNPDENNSIGMILCAGKDNVEVEMALEDVNKPIGVSEYEYLIPQNELKDLIASEVAQWGRRQ